jgi:hypothetical protein
MRLYLILSIVVSPLISRGQFSTYEKLIEIAEKFGDSNQYQSSSSVYDSAFKVISFVPYDYFNAFNVAMQENNYEKAYDYLCRGTMNGLEINAFYTKSTEKFKLCNFYESFNSKKDSLNTIYLSRIDTFYLSELTKLKMIDQNNRDDNRATIINDSLNFEQLNKLVLERGFPTFRKVGLGFNIAFLLLWHHRDEYPDSKQWKQIIPVIQSEIDKGEVTQRFFIPFVEFQKQNTK